MPRAENKTNGTGETAPKAGVVRLSDLTVEGRSFELEGKTYKTKSPINLTLPEIAKIDKMGKQISKDLPAFGEGNYDAIDLEAFQQILIDITVEISNVPLEVAQKAVWWQQLLIVGLFQSVAKMDFLGTQLTQLAGLPAEAREQIQSSLKTKQTELNSKAKTSTSPTP